MGNKKQEANVIYITNDGKTKNSVSIKNRERQQVTYVKGKPLEILAIDDKAPLQVDIKHQYNINEYMLYDKNMLVGSNVIIEPYNKQTLLIPGKYSSFNMYLNNKGFLFDPFIDTNVYDPLKLFYFSPNKVYFSPNKRKGSYIDNVMMIQSEQYNYDAFLFFHEVHNTFGLKDGKDYETNSLSQSTRQQIAESFFPEKFLQSLKQNSISGALQGISQIDLIHDFTGGKIRFKKINGKMYIIFKGAKHSSERLSEIKGWYYKKNNPKITNITYSPAGVKNFASDISKGALLGLIVAGSFEVMDWMAKPENERSVGQLLGGIAAEGIKAVVGSLITYGIMAIAVTLFAGGAPVIVIIGGAIIVSIGVGIILDWIDYKTGAKEKMKECGEEIENFLGDLYNEYLVKPLGALYYELECSIVNMYMRGY